VPQYRTEPRRFGYVEREKTMRMMRWVVMAAAGLVMAGLVQEAAAYTQFTPGEVWLDTDGKPINAHGGGVLYADGTYYWYGEIKEGKTYLPDCNKSWGGTRVDAVGVSCYSSKDLYNWKYEGNVLPVVADETSDLNARKVIERPKVIYNARTKKFVMWMHIDSMDYAAAKSGVATSDKPTGPFTYLGSLRPNAGVWPDNMSDEEKYETDKPLARDFEGGQMARDMTLFVDDDGKAYHVYSSEGNPTMHISLLTEDYLKPAGKYIQADAV
jgi:beta-galactosidase